MCQSESVPVHLDKKSKMETMGEAGRVLRAQDEVVGMTAGL